MEQSFVEKALQEGYSQDEINGYLEKKIPDFLLKAKQNGYSLEETKEYLKTRKLPDTFFNEKVYSPSPISMAFDLAKKATEQIFTAFTTPEGQETVRIADQLRTAPGRFIAEQIGKIPTPNIPITGNPANLALNVATLGTLTKPAGEMQTATSQFLAEMGLDPATYIPIKIEALIPDMIATRTALKEAGKADELARFDKWVEERLAEKKTQPLPTSKEIGLKRAEQMTWETTPSQEVKDKIIKINYPRLKTGEEVLEETTQKGLRQVRPEESLPGFKGIPSANVKPIIDAVRKPIEKIKGKTLTHEEVIQAAKESEILKGVTTREETLKREALLLRSKQQAEILAKGKGISEELFNNLESISSEATALGRQLESLKIPATEDYIKTKIDILKKLQQIGIKKDEIINASKNVDFKDAKQVQDFYRTFVKPNLGDIINEYRYINLLSSPKTHEVNMFTNLIQTLGINPLTKTFSGTIDNVASLLTGKSRTRYISEVPSYYKGVFNSLGDAYKKSLDVLSGKSFVERPDIEKISTGQKILKPFQFIPRALEAGDVFARTLVRGGEIESLTLRAIKQGKKLTQDVIEQINREADKKAAYTIFRTPTDIHNVSGQGKLLTQIDKITSAVYTLRRIPGVRWFVPFVETPMNIVKQGIEYSPIGVSTIPGNVNKIDQISKSIIGSTVFSSAAYLAFSDRTTWGIPKNEKDKKIFFASGKQPYSLKVGDNWISFSRLGPIAYPMAMASAIKYYSEDSPTALSDTKLQKVGRILSGMSKFFSDQSYVEGIRDLISVTSGEEGAVQKAIVNAPSQLVPLSSLLRWVTQMTDPIYRKADKDISVNSIIQTLEKSIPILSQNVPAYTDIQNKPSERQYRFLNPFIPTTVSKENKPMSNLLENRENIAQKRTAIKKQIEERKKNLLKRY